VNHERQHCMMGRLDSTALANVNIDPLFPLSPFRPPRHADLLRRFGLPVIIGQLLTPAKK
jgi:hypothetical protein